MSMPKYPEERKMRSYQEIVKDILESVALEELAIAHLINAEAEKIQAFTGHYGGFPTAPSNKQINEFQTQVARILEALAEKQKILVRTIELSKELLEDCEELEPDEELYE
ncbi:hypothetical protein [Paenibacillus turpanensis]|uniref:hypothetical protein n=1 Tax=Paenibacillus turpanensis TaxID=2689078 RepID=UPI0014076718|nr:hypothetical protein [Paenibacillus turpanensis]